MKTLMHCAGILLIALGLAGCQAVPETQVAFAEDEAELMLNCCLDITGSFERQMLGTGNGQEGKAFKTFLMVRDRFFKDREQSKDRFVVVGKEPLWVLRHEDYDMMAHWEHAMDGDAAKAAPKK